MTAPQPSNQLPEEVKPPYKISEREPVWPCWLYSTHYDFWSKHDYWSKPDYWEPLAGPEEHGWTHWHPDQPTAPTVTPYLAPRPPAQVDAGWAKAAAEECYDKIGRGSWEFESSTTSIERFADIIESHAPAADELARLRERQDIFYARLAEVLPLVAGGDLVDASRALVAQLATLRQERDEDKASRDFEAENLKAALKERDELRAQLERLTAPLPDAEEYAKHVIAHLYPDHSNGARLVQIALNEWLNRHLATLRRERDEARAKESRVTLSVREIFDLAGMAGLKVEGTPTEDDDETEVTVTPCPASGVIDEEDDGKAKGEPKHYKHVAYFEEYPEEGVCPLGTALDSARAKQGEGQPEDAKEGRK